MVLKGSLKLSKGLLMNLEEIIQKYSQQLSQKIYDCFMLETKVENLDKLLQDKDKEIERLRKLLDDNGIDYKTDDEVSFSPVEDRQKESVE